MNDVNVIVNVAEHTSTEDVVNSLQSIGFRVTACSPENKTVNGIVASNKVSLLTTIPGVASTTRVSDYTEQSVSQPQVMPVETTNAVPVSDVPQVHSLPVLPIIPPIPQV